MHQRVALARGDSLYCRRCGAELYRERHLSIDAMLAVTLSGLVMFLIANVFPVLKMQLGGAWETVTLWDAIFATYDAGTGFISVLAALCLFFLPLSQILLFSYILLPLRAGQVPPGFRPLMHIARHMRPWSMVEVFLVGILVAAVKLTADSQITPGVGLWALAVLTINLTLLRLFDLHDLWDYAEQAQAA